jgi:hypothetical protein
VEILILYFLVMKSTDGMIRPADISIAKGGVQTSTEKIYAPYAVSRIKGSVADE